MWRACCIAALAGLLLLLPATGARAVSLAPVGEEGDFDQPIYVTSAPEDANRLFVVEREGEIKQVEGGSVSTLADLSSVVECCAGERGLLSIALAPDFAASGRFYVDYTGTEEPGEIHVAELQEEGTVTDPPSSLRNVLTIGHPGAANHNGGQLQFGPDGYLYVSTGDGGGGNDVFENAQNRERLLGKLLRVEPRPGEEPPYAIPEGNPFAGSTPGLDEIWAYGLRNPWRFSFDHMSGDLVIADVGQGTREEIDYEESPAPEMVGGGGANYGWNCREGTLDGPEEQEDPECADHELSEFIDPVFDYPTHVEEEEGGGIRCSIIGGYVVRDPSLGALYGRYLYGDLCTGWLRSIDLSPPEGETPEDTDRREPASGLPLPEYALHSFGEDSSHRIYVVSGEGQVYCLQAEGGGECLEGSEPAPKPEPEPEPEPEPTPEAQSQPAAAPGQALLPTAALPKVRQTLRSLPARVRARAASRRVRRGRRARIVVWVRPCAGNRRRRVRLHRGGRRIARRQVDRRCRARFRPRIAHRSIFKAVLPQPLGTPNAESQRLVIRVRGGA